MSAVKFYLDRTHLGDQLTFERKTKGAAGYDLHASLGCERELLPGQRWIIPTGLYLEMPPWCFASVCTRSRVKVNHGCMAMDAVIDSDYRGEISIVLINLSTQPYTIVPGERVAQLVLQPVLPEFYAHVVAQALTGSPDVMGVFEVFRLDALSPTERGTGRHGSTGR